MLFSLSDYATPNAFYWWRDITCEIIFITVQGTNTHTTKASKIKYENPNIPQQIFSKNPDS